MDESLVQKLKEGDVAVIPTDTLYGVVGSALNSNTVEDIYKLRGRDENKPMIVLIRSLSDIKAFDISLTEKQKTFLLKVWPGKVSAILSCESEEFEYLHRGTKTIAFRVPHKEDLRKLLRETGPLVAPSANTQGKKPSENIAEAQKYFGDNVNEYVDGGVLAGEPSTVIDMRGDEPTLVREGAVAHKEIYTA